MNYYRSLLFTPGTQKERLLKSLNSNADALIWDLEDAVHPKEKDKARTIIAEVLNELPKKPDKPIYLRVNAFDTPWFSNDVSLARHEAVTGLVLPKTEYKHQVSKTWELMNQKGEIIILVESANGIKNLEDILNHKNISGVALGAIDLAVDLDLTLTDSGVELIYARSKIVVLAKCAGIKGIYDTVFPDIHNTVVLRHRAKMARRMGFNGQLAIHPKQIDIIHEVYSPTIQEIEWSRKVLDIINDSKNIGVFTLDGKMIDRPVIEKAKQIYTAACRFGLIS